MSPRDNTILFFPFNLLSHYVRCLKLAEQYKDNYRIYFRDSERYNDLIKKEGYETFDCPELSSDHVIGCMKKFDFGWINQNEIERIFLAQISCIAKIQPTFIVGDMSPSLKMASEITNTRFISLINGYMSKYYALGRPIGSLHPASAFKRVLPEWLFSIIVNNQERKKFYKIHKPFKKIRRKYQLSMQESFLDELEGDDTLICDVENIFPQKNLPESYKNIGPLLFTFEDNAYFQQVLSKDKANILITMGSSGDLDKIKFLNDKIFSIYHFIVLGDTSQILKGNHITHLNYTDLNSILNFVALVICHGGNGTLNYCYNKKTPFIAVPSTIEQEWNGLRFQEVMKGQTISKHLNKEKMIREINKMLML